MSRIVSRLKAVAIVALILMISAQPHPAAAYAETVNNAGGLSIMALQTYPILALWEGASRRRVQARMILDRR